MQVPHSVPVFQHRKDKKQLNFSKSNYNKWKIRKKLKDHQRMINSNRFSPWDRPSINSKTQYEELLKSLHFKTFLNIYQQREVQESVKKSQSTKMIKINMTLFIDPKSSSMNIDKLWQLTEVKTLQQVSPLNANLSIVREMWLTAEIK